MAVRGCGQILACLSFLMLISSQSNIQAQTTTEASVLSAATVQDINSVIPNFGIVSPTLLRGGQPRKGGLASLKRAGVKTIVNLRDGNEDIRSEKALAEELGLNFVSIPMSVFKHASKEQVDQFMKVVKNPDNPMTFVHCRQGMDRCGTMVAMYRMKEQSWTAKAAYEEMLKYGFHPFLLGLRWSVFSNDPALLAGKDAINKEPGKKPAPAISSTPSS
ncbi:MAG: tyrosine-protein phosphatase [Cyanobacteria bacterium]|nr:tyrosine-protein phosphatase [Cyanobacteriota bacterium]